MSFFLSGESLKEIEKTISLYPEKAAAVLPILQLIQKEAGFISPEAEIWVSDKLDLPLVRVREVVTFYTLLRRKPAGRHTIRACRNLSCFMAGAPDLLTFFREKYNLEPGQTTSDGRLTLETAECLGNCDQAPCIMVNEKHYSLVGISELENILSGLK